MIDMNKRIEIDTKDLDRFCIGKILYDAFDYGNENNLFHKGSKEKELTIKESDIVGLIKLVNNDSIFKNRTKVKVIKED